MNTKVKKSNTTASDVRVEVSSDYSKFAYIEGNRPTNKGNVERIMKSMEKLFVPVPIIVNERKEIIDGQHRFSACQKLGLPVYYIMKEGLGLKDVILLNHDQKKWSLQNYVDAHAEKGIKEYKTLKALQSHPDYQTLGFWHIVAIAKDIFRRVGGGDAVREIEQGELKLALPIKEIHNYLARLSYVSEILKGFRAAKDDMVFSFMKLLKSQVFDEDLFLTKLRMLKEDERFIRELYFISGSQRVYVTIIHKWNELFPDKQMVTEGFA